MFSKLLMWKKFEPETYYIWINMYLKKKEKGNTVKLLY